MINIKEKKHISNKRVRLSRIAIVVVTIAIIVTFLPRNEKQSFHYDVGSPWMYSTLIAQFDFPIYKDNNVYEAEKDSAMEEFQPYYTLDPDVEKTQIAKLEEDYKNGIPGLPDGYLRMITNRLHRIYQSGVMKTSEYVEIVKDTTHQVRIVVGKESQSVGITYLNSARSAYEKLFVDSELGEYRHLLQDCNLNNYIEPNLIYDKARTESEKQTILSDISQTKGVVKSGQKIIDRGDIVDPYTDRVIKSLDKEKIRRNEMSGNTRDTLLGQIILVTVLIVLFTTYLALFRRDYFEKPRSILMMYLLLTIFPVLISLVMKHTFFSVYFVPLCMAPIFIRVFMDSRTAYISHATMVLICAIAVNYQYEFLFVQLIAGMVTVYTLREMSSRSQVLKTALLVVVVSIAVYFALQKIQSNDLQKLDSDMYYHFMVNGVLLLLSYPLMYLIEKMFGFTSDVTLFELSNTNKGVLRELSENAPGTFQHSITVGNLAADIANRISADSLLVRTGALYHDIGKMENPVFFTENQANVNPHSQLSNTASAKIIISHISNGISLAEKYDLPQFIKDFILTHHGKGMAKYFYIQEKNANPDKEINVEAFTYPGPNPFTREQAILMMADACEAASRSLKEYSDESISALINRIIDSQVAEGYFRECPITFRDIATAKQVLIDRLKNIYHTRISYPEATAPVQEEKVETVAESETE